MDFHMSFWNAIVLIVLISAVAKVMKAKAYARHGITDIRADNRLESLRQIARPADGEDTRAMQQELEQLRERVKVLERIATDERHSRQIAAEIEALRDK